MRTLQLTSGANSLSKGTEPENRTGYSTEKWYYTVCKRCKYALC